MNLVRMASQHIQMTTDPIDVDCARLVVVDLSLIDRVARLQVAARRLGFELRLINADAALVELVDQCGLSDALRVEVKRQPEEREEAGRVEEERDLGDPAV